MKYFLLFTLDLLCILTAFHCIVQDAKHLNNVFRDSAALDLHN